ncbi:MAG TPA: ParB/Srx family N-terminal domain-containing protein, partial [Chthoniobacterales bacterium]|nr:ParB/Srx family N-terminal domain-containing protein [Chthoniobacterales bacterium]
MPARDLKIENLLLDVENPRISRAGGQKDALQKIIEDQDVKLVALAESIIEDGGLNPMDRLLVIRSPDVKDKYVVLEGNRRFAAIKILHNPAVLTGLEVRAMIQKRFEDLATGF